MTRRFRNTWASVALIGLVALVTLPTTWAQPHTASNTNLAAQSTENLKLPDTPAGKTFAAFLSAFNSGDIEVMRKFHSDRKGNPENAERDLEAYKRTGGLKLIKVNSSADYALEVLVETKPDSRHLNFAIEVDSNAPHRILKVQAQPVQE